MVGETPPSSLVISLSSNGSAAPLLDRGLARRPFDTGTEDDGVVAERAAGDVYVGHRLVVHEVLTDVSAPGDDPEEAGIDQWGERRAEDRQDGVGHRVELEHHDPVVGVQLVEHVQRRNRGDVAGAEHQPDAAGDAEGSLAETGLRL